MTNLVEIRKRTDVPRHEVLAAVRGQMENGHRKLVTHRSAARPFEPCTLDTGSCSQRTHENVSDIPPEHAEDCCNRAVPIYLIPSGQYRRPLIGYALNNWLYRKWYRPYRNEIAYCRFIAKQFYPCTPPDTTPLVPFVNRLHGSICSQVLSYQKEVVALPVTPLISSDPCFRDQQFLTLQPLFQAMTIILLEDDFHICMKDLGKLPVLITLTGQEDNLSAPLSFDSIKKHVIKFVSDTAVQVPLGIAFDFIMAMEQREIDAFGLQPYSVETPMTNHEGVLSLTHRYVNGLLQRHCSDNEPVQGASSTWVDTRIYTNWPEDMIQIDNFYAWLEKRERRFMLRDLFRTDVSRPRPSRRCSI